MDTGSFNAKRRLVLCSALVAGVAIGGYLKRRLIEDDPAVAASQANSRYSGIWKLGRFGLLGLCVLGLCVLGLWLLRFRARSFLTSTVRMLLR